MTTKIYTQKTENVYSDNQKYIFGQPEIYMWTTKIQIWRTNHLYSDNQKYTYLDNQKYIFGQQKIYFWTTKNIYLDNQTLKGSKK